MLKSHNELQTEKRVQDTPRKVVGVASHNRQNRQQMTRRKPKKLCCCGRRPISPESEDRIEHAFRKMDPNNTGYVTWKEFKKVISH